MPSPEAEAAARSPAEQLAATRLYLCLGPRPDLGGLAEAAVRGGVGIVQYRDKTGEWADQLAGLTTLAAAVERAGRVALVAANDRADVAALAGVSVLHLGQRDLPPALARRVVGPHTLIGVSTHTPEELEWAAADPEVDYLCVGPVWATPTKPGRPATGLELVRRAARLGPAQPWFAIGGVDAARLPALLDAGARRAVVVRAVAEAADPEAAAAELVALLAGG